MAVNLFAVETKESLGKVFYKGCHSDTDKNINVICECIWNKMANKYSISELSNMNKDDLTDAERADTSWFKDMLSFRDSCLKK